MRNLVHGIRNARQQRKHLKEHGDCVRHVAVANVERGEKEADAERRHERETEEHWGKREFGAGRPLAIAHHQRHEHEQTDHEVDCGNEHSSDGKQHPRKVDLRDEVDIGDETRAGKGQRGGEVLHREQAREDEDRVLDIRVRKLRELAEDDDVDGGREHRHE